MSRGDGGARCVVLANCVDGGAHAGSSSIVRALGQMTVSPMPQRPEVAAASAAADPAANVTARCVVLANCVDGGAHAGSSSIVRALGQMTVSPMPQRPEVAAASAAADPAANVTAAARCVVLATDSVLNAAKAIGRQVSSMPQRAQSSRPAGFPAAIAHGIRMANRLSHRADRRNSIAKRSPRNCSTLVGLSDEQLKLMAAHLEQRQQLLQLHLEQRQQLLQLPPWELHQLYHKMMGDLTVTEG